MALNEKNGVSHTSLRATTCFPTLVMATAVGGGWLNPTSSKTSAELGGRRAAAEARALISSEDYLSAHDVRGVLLNALRHVQRACSGDTDTVRHIEAAAEYFHSVATARYIAGRAFQEVTATSRNRAAFHVNARRVLEAMANVCATAPAEDWHEILVRLCPDLPFGVTRLAVSAACADETHFESAEVSGAALAPALRVAVEQWRFLERVLADAFDGEPNAPRDAERCLETIFSSPSSTFRARVDDADDGSSAKTIIGSDDAIDASRTAFAACAREAMAAAATKTEAGATATHAAFAVATCRHPQLRFEASRACEAAARRAEAAEAAATRDAR